ncbi:hypothetical protein [Mucilaginibacter pedocola]|uniref:Uncharacterized protein n=1 Tax=Mucilaginibacter pedocola TaxID=1792845 RepID=A0A1S9PL73_9SPHI|nr:hypothetical protein [Mucilaginibacter pedocola]OOQ61722.1 hypothetical protein BC343_01220 [Mucilaginibacter pedocola]
MDPAKPKSSVYFVISIVAVLYLLALAGIQFFIQQYFIAGFMFFFAVVGIYRFSKEIKGKTTRLPGQLIFITLGSVWTYRDYNKYTLKKELAAWQQKFGTSYNHVRVKIGAPTIPADWKPDYADLAHMYWNNKFISGHYHKMIVFDTLKAIAHEEDVYKLDSLKGKERSIEIITQYARDGRSDSIFYRYYQTGSDMQIITHQKADSLLDAEKLSRDY